jgi:hypothetical protein
VVRVPASRDARHRGIRPDRGHRLAYAKIPVFLSGMTGIAFSFIAAAFMALKLANGIADGRYRDIHPAPWRQQVW